MRYAPDTDLRIPDDPDLPFFTTLVQNFYNDMTACLNDQQVAQQYYDGDQWSAEDRAVLERRGQAALVINLIDSPINAYAGAQLRARTKWEAKPRTSKDVRKAQIASGVMNYVADRSCFSETYLSMVTDYLITGIAACFIEAGPDEINPKWIPYEHFIYDYQDRDYHFRNARFLGISKQLTVHEDRVTQLWFRFDRDLQEGVTTVWYHTIFKDDAFIVEPEPSPWLDAYGNPTCPMVGVSANIDYQFHRYGIVRGMIPLQDEVNHRRSKALHMLSVRQTFADATAFLDGNVTKFRRAMTDPQGHIEVAPGAVLGQNWGVLENQDLVSGQMALLQTATAELKERGAMGETQALNDLASSRVSGNAVSRMQAYATLRIDPLLARVRSFDLAIAKQVWAGIRQFWIEERIIRLMDEDVVINNQPTALDRVKESFPDASQEELLQAANESGVDPYLPVGEDTILGTADVDIIFGSSTSAQTMLEDQQQFILQALPMLNDSIPAVTRLRLLFEALPTLPNREQLLEEAIQLATPPPPPEPEPPNPLVDQMLAAELDKVRAEAAYKEAQALERYASANKEAADAALRNKVAGLPIETQAQVPKDSKLDKLDNQPEQPTPTPKKGVDKIDPAFGNAVTSPKEE